MTDAELTVLSLMAEGPQHGYQIQQAIDARGVRNWTAIGFSSGYYVLNKSEQDGRLTSKMTPSPRGPARKVYALAEAGRRVLQTAIANLLSLTVDAFEQVDIILGPTSPTTAFPIGSKMDDPVAMYLEDVYTLAVNLAGLPGISVPAGLDKQGLPLGLQLIGRPWEEGDLLNCAYALEQAAGFVAKPGKWW